MRLFILFLVVSIAFLPIGCDEPLVIDQSDNEAAIQLSSREDGGQTVLNWTPVNHPGFNKYWLVRVPSDSTLVSDSLQFLDMQVLYETTEPANNTFTDNVPLLGDGDYYQIYADVNGRLVQSNAVLSKARSFTLENHVSFNVITGGDGRLFMVMRNLITGEFDLQVYDLESKRILNSTPIETGVSSRARIAYGDFGSGKKEIAFTNLELKIDFYDAESLTITHSQILGSGRVEAMAAIPGHGLAIVQLSGSQIVMYSRKSNSFRNPFTLQGGFSSTTTFIKPVQDRQQFIISIAPDRLHRIGYDQNGSFSQLDYQQFTSSANISSDLAIDPRGEYVMPSRIGELYRLNDFSYVTQFKGDSIQPGFRAWGFTAGGSRILLGGINFPTTVFIYDRDDFSLQYEGNLPATLILIGVVEVDDDRYLMIQKNEQPFQMIFSEL
ncbi:MAG: hypothetical protein R3B47_01375 [Bacteroidia bacterium]